MKNTALFLLIGLSIVSCKQSDFMQDIQGKWKVTEVEYMYTDTSLMYNPSNMNFIFDNYDYQSIVDNNIVEQGTFYTNAKATQINFSSDQGNSVFLIQERSDQYQNWRSKNKIIDFYLGFRMEKVQ